jgi:hypothetical protein
MISGYRKFDDYNKFKITLDDFIKQNGILEMMIFGECFGTDKLALRYAVENNIDHKIFNADWKQYGLSAGPIRNNEMIKMASHLIAFISCESKGTKQAVNSAKKNKLIVIEINI